MKYLLVGTILLFVISCSNDEVVILNTPNDVLNSQLNSASSTSVILIDSTSVDTVFADQSNVISPQGNEPEVVMGRVSGLSSLNEIIYLSDLQNSSVWRIDKNNDSMNLIGRSGSGPGEFEMLMGIEINSSSIFTVEPSRIQQFDTTMTYVDEISQVVFGEKIAVSENYLIAPLNPNANDFLLQVREAQAPFEEIARFMQPIIPPGFQPGAYNNVEFSINDSGQIAAAYLGLPYLFIFNEEFNIEQVIHFEFDGDGLENPSPEPVRNAEAMRVSSFIENLNLLDDGTIYFTHSMNMYKLVQERERYRLDKTIHYTFSDPVKREETPWGLQPTSLHVHDDIILVGSIFEESIYHFHRK